MSGILITGGLGYVGGRIADHLAQKRPEARIVLTSSRRDSEHADWTRAFSVMNLDLGDPDSIRSCVKAAKVDTIIHLGALNARQSLADPLKAYRINQVGTWHLADAAQSFGVERLVYFSTFHVYGTTQDGLAITEESPTRCAHPYAATHRAAEDVLSFFHRYHGLKTLVLRLSNGYGYPMDARVNAWDLVVNDLCGQAVSSASMRLETAGRQQRDFIALSDVARAVEFMLYERRESWGDGLYNLGQGSAISILDMAHRVADCYERRYGKRPELTTGQAQGGNEVAVNYAVDKLNALGFRACADMDAEISGTLAICETML
jgi:UDP-glucose 4-epimerase